MSNIKGSKMSCHVYLGLHTVSFVGNVHSHRGGPECFVYLLGNIFTICQHFPVKFDMTDNVSHLPIEYDLYSTMHISRTFQNYPLET